MNSKIYDLAYALHQALEEHGDVILLQKVEQELADDQDLSRLFAKYEAKQNDINELLTYLDVENEKVKTLRKELSALKFTIDTNPLVIKYNAQYKTVNLLYKKVSQKLFVDFINIKECKCL